MQVLHWTTYAGRLFARKKYSQNFLGTSRLETFRLGKAFQGKRRCIRAADPGTVEIQEANSFAVCTSNNRAKLFFVAFLLSLSLCLALSRFYSNFYANFCESKSSALITRRLCQVTQRPSEFEALPVVTVRTVTYGSTVLA